MLPSSTSWHTHAHFLFKSILNVSFTFNWCSVQWESRGVPVALYLFSGCCHRSGLWLECNILHETRLPLFSAFWPSTLTCCDAQGAFSLSVQLNLAVVIYWGQKESHHSLYWCWRCLQQRHLYLVKPIPFLLFTWFLPCLMWYCSTSVSCLQYVKQISLDKTLNS